MSGLRGRAAQLASHDSHRVGDVLFWSNRQHGFSQVASIGIEMEKVVLSLSFNVEELRRRESTLRAHGFDVKSVHSPGQARFEIEMGQCGVFITSDLVPDIVNQDLMELFRKSCPKNGMIILVEANKDFRQPSYELKADVTVPKSMDPEGIVDALRTRIESRGELSA